MSKLSHHIVLVVLAGLFILLAAGGSAWAQTTTHSVESGETLFQIAKEHNVTVQQLRNWNNLSGSQLSIGQKLVIRKESAEQESGSTHTVKANETLYSISKKYGVSIAEIKEWNNIQTQNLSIGTELKIYPDKSTQSNQPENSRVQRASTYTVKSGDSLYRIAQLHNMTINRLKEINNLSSNNIQVGQKLSVRPTDQPPSLTEAGVETSAQGKFIRYTIDESQTLSELLNKFRMATEEFQALNPGLTDTTFRRGEKVTLLAPANESFKNPYTVNSSMSRLGSTTVAPYQSQKIAPTTSGELYNPEALTAAHPNIAMGSVIFVKNEANQRGVFIRINDRTTGSSMKLSQAAWNTLALSGNQGSVTMFRSDE